MILGVKLFESEKRMSVLNLNLPHVSGLNLERQQNHSKFVIVTL